MTQSRKDGEFEIRAMPIIGPYGVQRFTQFGCEDSANWAIYTGENTKRPYGLYPTLGRAHISYNGQNQLVFGSQPRGLFKSIKYSYSVVGNAIYRIDQNYNQLLISFNSTQSVFGLATYNTPIYFSYLVVNAIVFSCFVDQENIYVYQENTGIFYKVTDPLAPGQLIDSTGMTTKPGYIATFGNRITVSCLGSSQFCLSVINLLTNGSFDPNKCFTNANPPSIFAQEDGIIRQMGVLNNTLYIFCDFVTGVWSNIQAVFGGTGVTFPWKKSSTYNWNFGIANSSSLDIDFGYMAFLAQNSDGLLQFMVSQGGQPEKISDEPIDVLLQNYTNKYGANNPFLSSNSNGFLYQYENKIFYRMSGGPYFGYGILDQEQQGNSIEYSFDIKKWHRCIELNGERNRIQLHVYFNSKHLVSVINDNVVYEMSGKFYFNEDRNPSQTNAQAPDAFYAYPLRYERISPQISEFDYAEFETEYVEIDFVFGQSNILYSTAPFQNAQFLVAENSTPANPVYIVAENPDSSGNPVYILTENSNFPTIFDNTYNTYFTPSVELYYSDDGGISFNNADQLQFSQMGVYQWRMRWYQMGPSRNRVYKLIAVSAVPIVVLGAVMNVRRISGGAN